MKKLLVALALLTLVGCDASTTEKTSDYILPHGLENCKVYRLNGHNSQDMTVLYCPGKTTTSQSYSCGKSCTRDITVVSE